jgi:hypothetical protein
VWSAPDSLNYAPVLLMGHGPLPLNLPAWLRTPMQSQSITRELMYVMMQMRGNSASCGHCPGQGTISVVLDGETESAAATMHDAFGAQGTS